MPVAPARRSILELLLDPRSIHWLLGSGGALVVAGLVVWLASLGVFHDPIMVAGAMGAGTVGVLGAGWAVMRRTRYQLAGRAVTLLACLVMPLNLWFYQAHELVTLDGHLWLAGVVCCVLYAASAWRLRDALFVHVLCAGVAMTGLLMLADLHRFAEIASPSTLLIVLGLIALHVERAFPVAVEEVRQPFCRQRFGRAFFRSGQALIGGGLALLLGAQVAGWMTIPFVQRVFHVVRPGIVTDPALRAWALGLVVAATYAYVYSGVVVRRVGAYLYVAAGTLLWGEVLAIDLLHLSAQPAALIAALSLTAVAVNVLRAWLGRRFAGDEGARPLAISAGDLAVLNLLPVMLGVAIYFRASAPLVGRVWPMAGVGLAYAVAMLVAAGCCRVGAHLARKTSPRAAAANLYASAAAVLAGTAAMLAVRGLSTPASRAPVLMLIPIAYLGSARVRRGDAMYDALQRVAQVTAGWLFAAAVLASARQFVPSIVEAGARPAMASYALLIVYAEAAVFYAATALMRRRAGGVYLATLAGAAAVWHALVGADASTTACIVAYAAMGLAMLAVLRLVGARLTDAALSAAAARCANAVTGLAFLSATLLTLSHLAGQSLESAVVGHLGAMAVMSLVASRLAGRGGWRRAYVTAAAAQAALAGIVFQRRLNLSPWQHVEHALVLLGALLLALGHAGWHREQGRECRSGTVSGQLGFGSLLAGVPLAIAAIAHRVGGDVSLDNEFALVTVGIVLLISGYICQIRSTMLTGGALLAVQLAMMLVCLGVRAQLAVGVYLTLGGAAVFGTGLLLSVHRDRLAGLPQRIRERRGVFKVLSWR